MFKKTINSLFTSVIISFAIFVFAQSGMSVQAALKTSINVPNTYVNIGTPEGLVALPGGGYWYVDSLNGRIVKVSNSGSIVRTVGRIGNEVGEFSNTPVSITRDNDGYLYVLQSNCIIKKLDTNGGVVTSWGTCGTGYGELSDPKSIYYDNYSNALFITSSGTSKVVKHSKTGTPLMDFGSNGNSNGQFQRVMDVATDSTGKIFVVDTDHHQVQVFNANGTYAYKFGSFGGGDGQLVFPNGIGVQSNGNVVVASQNSQRVVVYSNGGTWLSTFGEGGINDGQFSAVGHISIGPSNEIFVSDFSQQTIQRFDSDGVFISSLRNNTNTPGHLSYPQGIAYDVAGNLYVSSGIGGIQKFSSLGVYISTIGGPHTWFIGIDPDNRIFTGGDNGVTVYDTDGNYLFSIGTGGSGIGQFSQARGVDFDSLGNIYIADSNNSRIQVYDNTGEYITTWGTPGTGEGEIMFIDGVAIDSNDNIYLADSGNYKVMKFTTAGVYLQTLASSFNWPRGLAVDAADNLYVTEMHGHQIQVFDDIGNQLSVFGSMGGGINQFNEPSGIAISPTNGKIAITDALNNRVQILAPGVRIENLIPSADVLRNSDQLSLTSFVDPATPGIDGISSELYFGAYIVSDLTVDLSVDRDWSSVNATSVPEASKALLVNLNPVDAPGASATHSLYIVKDVNQTSVYVCPNASTLADVTQGCAGGYILEEGAANLSTVNVNGVDYWKIDGLTGTGALGLSVQTPTTRLVVTPNNSAISATQEVVLTYTSGFGFIDSDKIQFFFEPGSGFVLADTCATPTEDANGDATPDGSAVIVGNDVYEYTFNDTVAAGALSFCVNVTSPATAGSYSVRLTDDNGTFDNAMYYVGDDNDVFVIANVAPSLSFNIRTLADDADTNVCAFGTVSPSDIIPNYDSVDDGASECGYSLAVGTNAVGGFQTQISSDDLLNGPSGSIASVANGGTFSTGVEAYGLASISPALSGRDIVSGYYNQDLTRDGNFNLATDTATGIPVSATNFISFTSGVEYLASSRTDDVTKVMHGLVIGSGTPAGYYDQVLTYTTTANF
jgi:sugar lactone lactonase YvrE